MTNTHLQCVHALAETAFLSAGHAMARLDRAVDSLEPLDAHDALNEAQTHIDSVIESAKEAARITEALFVRAEELTTSNSPGATEAAQVAEASSTAAMNATDYATQVSVARDLVIAALTN